MAEAEARFVISLDTAGANANASGFGSSLEKLKSQITSGTKALQEMQATAARLKGSVDVQAFENVGKSLQKAQGEIEKGEAPPVYPKHARYLAYLEPCQDVGKHGRAVPPQSPVIQAP